jgi:predicted DNA-binding protein
MFDAIKPLLDSGIINEETRTAINEAWEAKLVEAREQVRAELREEMAARYEHDKKVMVEALDKMVTDQLTAEIAEFAAEKKAVVEDRVRVKEHMMESAGRFDNFMVNKLAEEIKELHKDREVQKENYQRLEKFIVTALAKEIREFAQDKQEVVETKVRLVAEGKKKLDELRSRFIKNSARLVKESVTAKLGAELTQLKEDIQVARENMFGRRIFEAYASEFSLTHLNENREIQKLRQVVDQQQEQITEASKAKAEVAKLVESKDREIRVIKESAERKEVMNQLLGTLNKEKQTVMRELLENVQTDKLKSAFDKYLPAVLTNGTSAKEKATVLAESRVEVTGDKTTAKAAIQNVDNNVFELRRLAGLK